MIKNMEELTSDFSDHSRHAATDLDEEPCKVSVPEASELFAAAGVPRTGRAIQRFCKKGELKCAFVETPFGSKYLIARSSIDRLIVQKKQAQEFANDASGRDLSGPDATNRDRSRQDAGSAPQHVIAESTDHEEAPHQHSRDTGPRPDATAIPDAKDRTIEDLRGENFNLKVDNLGKQNFIRQLVVDREQMLGEIKNISFELGAARSRVAQLEAPATSRDEPRPVATPMPESVTEPAYTDPPPPKAQQPSPPPSRKRWRIWG